MRGNKKGFLMTLLVLILFLLMLSEVITFVTLNSTYNQISQNLQTSSGTNNYAQALQSSSASFAQSSLSRALQTLYLYESNPQLRKSNFVTNFNATIASLIKNSTIANVTPNSAAANTIKSYMGGLSLLYYNASVAKLLGASGSSVIINETGVSVFQNSPFTLSLSYIENVNVNTTYGAFQYNIPVYATISLNNTPNLLAAQEGVSKYVQFTTANLTSVIGSAYASSGNTIGFQYGLTLNLPSAVTCSQLTTLASNANVNTAPSNNTVILVTADASEITNSICNHANNFGGLVTTAITNAPPIPYLVYPSGSSVINLLQTGQSVLLYGPGLDVLNISRLRAVAANGYYMASPYAMSYSDIASDSVLHQSQNGIFTFYNFDTQVASFNGVSSNIVTPNVPTSAHTLTVSAWVNPTAGNGNRGIIGQGAVSGNWQLKTFGGSYDFVVYGTKDYTFNSLVTNTVSFVTAVYNSGNVLLYVNGNEVAAYSGGPTLPTNKPLYIGYTPSDAAPLYFNGIISNIQVYNSSLTTPQVQTLYQRGISGLPIANNGLAGWWPLNGNANDYSGFNNNGVPTGITYALPANYIRDSILINNYTSGLQPIPGLLLCNDNSDCTNPAFPHLYTGTAPLITNSTILQAANFNGASSYINTGTIAAQSSGTISFWVYRSNTNVAGYIFQADYHPLIYTGGAGPSGGFQVFWNGATGLPVAGAYSDQDALQSGQWYFLTITWTNGAAMSLYVNGVLYKSYTGLTLPTSSVAAYFGEYNNANYLNGYISNVQIYSASLSSAQVLQLYNGGINSPPISANIVEWWPLNGNPNDYSGNGNNGANNNVGYPQPPSGSYLPGNSRPNNYASELQTLGLVNN